MAFLLKFALERRPPEGDQEERPTTRSIAHAIKLRELGLDGPFVERLEGSRNALTDQDLSGPAAVHVAHAWDADFAELVASISKDSAGEVDRRYSVDIFSTDLNATSANPAEANPVDVLSATVAGAQEVLLVLDSQGVALTRLWVLFEALLAADAGKLRVRPGAPGGFGNSEAALRQWEAHIDATDWVLAQATRSTDEKRLRAHRDRAWEMHGKGVERMLAQLKKQLRRDVYGQILISAVGVGDRHAVEALLESGANPAQQDAFGNTVEELAASNGFTEIEELLFVRRLQRAPNRTLTSFFDSKELLASSKDVPKEVLAPFLTEPELSSEGEEEMLAGPFGGAQLPPDEASSRPSSSRSQQNRRAVGKFGVEGDSRSYGLTA